MARQKPGRLRRMTEPDAITWEPPGPGTWTHEAAHAPGAPTPWFRLFNGLSMEEGMRTAFARYGAPLETMQVAFPNGRYYLRLRPLVGGDSKMRPPPKAVLWLVTRLHPAFRRRNRAALDTFANKRWREAVDRWYGRQRGEFEAANLSFQDEPIDTYDDAALADHIRRVFEHTCRGHVLHFELHATDLGPLGDLIAHAARWGISAAEAVELLEGASPASAAPTGPLAELAAIVGAADRPPATLDELRALSPAAADALDAYLRAYAWRIVTAYDVDGRTLGEMPDAVLASMRAAGTPRAPIDWESKAAALRARVPAADRDHFDDLAAEARLVYGLRDDNGPLTAEWPIGLLRRALLEAGRRLTERGELARPEHTLELEPDELDALLRGRPAGVTSAEAAARAEQRTALARHPAPVRLGPEEAPPPVGVLPAGLARVTELVLAAVAALDAHEDKPHLHGTGIGSTAYRGTARVGSRPEEVLASMEPGDVLVAPFTTPAYNTVLSIAGAVIVEQGGPLCHAAVMARELDIPAVVGAAGALSRIADGDFVEVDPTAGRVSVLTATG